MTLTWDNGAGPDLQAHHRVDDKYMFTVTDAVENTGGAPVSLYPYGAASRHGMPQIAGYYILHEGLIGFLGDEGCRRSTTATSTTARPRR